MEFVCNKTSTNMMMVLTRLRVYGERQEMITKMVVLYGYINNGNNALPDGSNNYMELHGQ